MSVSTTPSTTAAAGGPGTAAAPDETPRPVRAVIASERARTILSAIVRFHRFAAVRAEASLTRCNIDGSGRPCEQKPIGQNTMVHFWRPFLAQYLLRCGGQFTSWGMGKDAMLLAPLAGAALVMSVATGPAVEPQGSVTPMTAQQKNAAMQPLVRSATDCIARAVAGDPRFGKNLPSDLGDLI